MGDPNAVARGGGTLAAKKPLKLDNLVVLDNQVGSVGAPRKLGDLESALGFSNTKRDTKTSPAMGLQDHITKAAQDPEIAKVAFAVLDLTQATPRYGGHRDTIPFYPASMGKMMIMLGAFQLRFDLSVLASKEKISKFDDLVDRVADIWADAQHPPKGSAKTVFRGASPKIELENDHLVWIGGKRVPMSGIYAPVRLDRVFDKAAFDAGRGLAFKSDDVGFHQLYYIEYAGQNESLRKAKAKFGTFKTTEPAKLAFWDNLRLMIGFSNNSSPRHLAADLNMVHVISPLVRSRLFHPDHGGLWMGHPYNSKNGWYNAPVGKDRTTGTALSLVTLMAAIVRRKLVDATGCDEMLLLLQKWTNASPGVAFLDDPPKFKDVEVGIGTQSFIGSALRGLSIDGTYKAWSKLGIFEGYSDTAYIERTLSSGKKLKYVMAILDVHKDHFDRIELATKAVDDAIIAIN